MNDNNMNVQNPENAAPKASNAKKKNRRVLKTGSYSVAVSVIVIAIVVVINLVVSVLPKSATEIDMSAESVFSLGDTTKGILEGIKEDIKLYYICEEGQEDTRVERIVNSYGELSDKITVVRVDPAIEPNFVSKYTNESLESNSVIAVSDKRSAVVGYDDMYMYYLDGYGDLSYSEYQQYVTQYYYSTGQYPSTTADRLFYGERDITSAVARAAEDSIPKIYYTTGHGETGLSSKYTGYIETENYELASLALVSEGVPEDAEAVIIYAPTLDISAEEAETLKTYIKGGGDIVLITGYEVNVGASMPNLSSVCEMMGMKSEDGLVLEGSQSNYYNNPLYLYPIIGSNGPTSPVSLLDSSNIGVLMPYSHGISAIEGAEGVTVTPVLSTTTSAYLKKTVDENTTVAKADGDIEGQFMVAAASTYSDDAENADGGRMVWYSSISVIGDSVDQMTKGNSQLFIATLHWMSSKTESISIIGKNVSTTYLTVTSQTASAWKWTLCIVVPGILIVAGFAVWGVRRRK